jgi:hypothetical protein
MFPASWRAAAEMNANMDFTTFAGKHPEELPRRRSLRALPAVVHPRLAMYLLFTAADRKFVVLHASLARDGGGSEAAARPPLPDEAWRLAQSRLDFGDY